jgi:hypothetical protein
MTASITDDPVEVAELAIHGLHERMTDGEAVTARQWRDAEASLRYELAKRDAAITAGERGAEWDRIERVTALRAELPMLLDEQPLERATAILERALNTYLDACREHDDRFDVARERLADPTLDPLPDDLALGPYQRPIIAGHEHRLSRPQLTINRQASEALRRHYPRQRIDLTAPPD